MKFDDLFLSERERKRREAEEFNRKKQEKEDAPPKARKELRDMDAETLVKIVNQRAFLLPE